MKIIKTVDYDTGHLASVTIRSSERDARDASIDVLKPTETDVRLPRGWYLFTDAQSEQVLLCRPTEADVLAELSSVMRRIQEILSRKAAPDPESNNITLLDTFRELSLKDSPEAWRAFVTARMQNAEKHVENAAREIIKKASKAKSKATVSVK